MKLFNLLFIAFLMHNTLYAQVPINDNPASATPLTIVYTAEPLVFSSGTNRFATNTYLFDPTYGYTQVPACVPSASQQKDIWFSFNSADFGSSITFTINEIDGSATYGHANLFRLFSTTNCAGVAGGGTFTQVDCKNSAASNGPLPTFTISGILPNTCYFLQMSCYLSTGSVWSSFEIAAKGNAAPLPLDYILLKGAESNGCNLLSWDVANENNIEKYELEKLNAQNNIYESTIGETKSLNQLEATYSLSDCKPGFQKNIYRVKVTDFDHKIYYSNSITINNTDSKYVTFYPNPAQNYVSTTISTEYDNINVWAIDMQGKKIKLNADIQNIYVRFDVSQLNTGLYMIRIECDDNFYVSELLKK